MGFVCICVVAANVRVITVFLGLFHGALGNNIVQLPCVFDENILEMAIDQDL